MTDHKEKDKETKKQRGLSRRAQLRRFQKLLENKQAVLELCVHRNMGLQKQIDELRRRLIETQKLVPFWVRNFP